jgi:hypothetical protein
MIRSIIVVLIILGSSYALTATHFLYPRAGKYYISKKKEARRSLRAGGGLYGPGLRGSGGLRAGK